ncbi:MAG: undecaprenyl/decaprenyl-phosphate alpha-N-acetylglucosaminyl 1-phosphate transferase [Sphingobacteriales bacterium]|nr:undecaprenyl/decaprenyl-phosphate alpha-N-acetylglucosaminyl 1-phosphate transferase [Sphingobacteriales bacterium]MBI3720659.1 undecaprenyl/decaprenyl-phosphate alpha-N-acetylglucosaminyl 1-phosphate transferase [Sphingobacteriales bacterium]
MDHLLIGVSIAFIVTFYAIPVIIRVADIKKLYDEPDERKIHSSPIPSLGGLGIYAGFLLAILIASPEQSSELQYYIAASLVIFFLGLKDDILILSPIKKFLGQLLAAFIIIYKGGVQIISMHGFLGVQQLPEFFSLALTYFTVIVVINSFNLIDGVDGLAGSLGVFTSAAFGLYFFSVNQLMFSVMGFALAGSLAAFLIFNYSPAKIFMGDTGAMLIGLVNSILVIKFINAADDPHLGGLAPLAAAPAIGFAILMIPLFDTLRVFGIRILYRRSPFSPDRNHIHHLLLDRGLSHKMVTFTIVTANILFAAIAYFFRNAGSTWLIFGMVSTGFSVISILFYSKPKPKLFAASEEENEKETKVIPFIKPKAVVNDE